ncbi:MAG: alpha/beta fold hydrolase [Acidimicrobiales bacterium]
MVELTGRGCFHVRELPGPAGAPLVMLLHGAAVSGSLNWYTSYEALARHVRVVSIDHRGHGESPHRARQFRLRDAADDAVALADHLGVDRFVPVGYSMGGPIAQLVWRRHPDRVRALVLAATFAHLPRGAGNGLAMRCVGRFGTGVRMLPRRRRLDLFLSAAEKMSTLPRRPAWQVSQVRAGSVPMMLEGIGELGRFDSRAWIGGVTVPTGVIVLNRDDVVPPDRPHGLASLIAHADVRYLDLLHDGCITTPDVFVPELVDLVRSLLRTSTEPGA